MDDGYNPGIAVESLEEEAEIPRHAVTIEYPEVVMLGPITGRIIRAWVEYPLNVWGEGPEATEVPEGELFAVAIQYEVSNPGFSPTPLDPSWSLSFTACSLDRDVSSSEFARMFVAHASEIDRIHGLTMVDHDITLRVNQWGNQAAEQHYPPFNRWLETI